MLDEKAFLENKLSSIQTQLSTLPEGTLSCAKNGNYYKWYRYMNGERSYIPRDQRSLAELLARKKYLSFLSDEIQTELRAINAYLTNHSITPTKSSQLLEKDSAYHELLSPYFKFEKHNLNDWSNEFYETNPKHPEQLTYKSISGHMLRSKSETIIDMLLFHNKIPFRYECALRLNQTIIYPDFTILHPTTGQIFYWEHFGLMDDPAYCRNTTSKLQLYISQGIIPTIQLITSYETRLHPLKTSMIEQTIQTYFL